MAKANKKEWGLVDILIRANHLPESTKTEVRGIAKEYKVQPFKAFQMFLSPTYFLEKVLGDMSLKERKMIVEAFKTIMKSKNWREKLRAVAKEVCANLKNRPQ